jgi:DNA-binding transcriptional LysR family regulator
VRGRVETDEFAFVRASAREGVGIAFTPIGMVASLVESGELERVLPRYALRGAPVHIVWPSRGFEPAAVRLLRDALVEVLAPTLA